MVQTVVRKMVDADDEISCDHPILLPEHVLACLLDSGMDIPESAVQRYWQHHRDMSIPWALQHASDGTHIPLGLYGDAAKYGDTNSKKIWGVFLNVVLFRPRSVRLSRFMLFAVDHETSFGVRTIYPLLAECVRSLNSVYDGVLGRKFCVTEIRGDWEFQYMIFRMKRFWNSSSLCWRCNATKSVHAGPDPSFLDFSERPSWKQTEHRTHSDFLATVIPNSGPRSCLESVEQPVSHVYILVFGI